MTTSTPGQDGSPAAPVEPTITGTFMQDYALGGPVTDTQRLEVLYPAQDGTLNVYSPVFFNQLGAQASIDRIYASTTSQTGWAKDRIVLPPEPGGNPVLMPTVVLTAETNTIVLFRQFCIQGLNLGPDGSINPSIGTIPKQPSIPMTSGVQPAGTAFFPEMMIDLSGNVTQVVLREVMGLKTYPVDWTGIPISKAWNSPARRQIFPLKQQSPNSYAFIALEDSGDVAYVRLEMASTGDRFTTVTHNKLASSASSCVHVREDTPGTVEILLLEPPAVTAITGTYTSGSDLQVQPTSAPQTIPEFPPPAAGTQYFVTGLTNPDSGVTELYIQVVKPGLDVTTEDLWLTTRRVTGGQAGDWEPPVLLDRGSRFIPFAANDVQTFATFGTDTGLDVWESSDAGTFEQERVYLEVDGPVADTQVYRVGIELGANAAPAIGAAVTISASETCVALIDGRRRVVGPKRPVQVQSNQQGAAWLSLAMDDSLYVPSIFISSPVLAHDLVLDPSDKIHTYLGNLESDALAAAKDPRTGTSVLPDPANAASVATAIRELTAITPTEPSPAIAGAPRLTSNVRAAWVEDGTIPGPKAVTQTAPSSFRLSKADSGIITFERLTSAQVEQHVADMATLPIVTMSILDIFEDAWDWVKSTVEDIVSIVVTGAQAALRVVIDGVTYAYNFYLDTYNAVFNAINMVLDYAGVLLGTALGWLLELLGFLFDWQAIKARRDHLRDVIYAQARAVPTFISDPQAALTAFSSQLQSARGTLADTLKNYQSSKGDSTPLGNLLSEAPVLSALLSPGFSSAAGSFLPQVTWLMDKATAVFPSMKYSPGFPAIPNLGSQFSDALAAVDGAGASFAGLVQDMSSLGMTWISDSRLFTSSTFDPIIEVVLNRLINILDALTAIVNAVAKVLSTIWSNVDKLIDWFDQPLPGSFFGGFYRGLTGNALSPFDIACLIAAIPSGVGGSPAASGPSTLSLTAEAAATDPDQDLKEQATRIMIASCCATAVNALYTAELPDTASTGESWLGYAITALSALLTQAASLVMSDAKGRDARFWISTVGTTLVIVQASAGAGAVAFADSYILSLGPGKFNQVICNYQMGMAVVHILNMILDIPLGDANLNMIFFDELAAIQNVLAVCVKLAKRPLPHPLALAYGGLQGGLEGIRTWLEADEPIPS